VTTRLTLLVPRSRSDSSSLSAAALDNAAQNTGVVSVTGDPTGPSAKRRPCTRNEARTLAVAAAPHIHGCWIARTSDDEREAVCGVLSSLAMGAPEHSSACARGADHPRAEHLRAGAVRCGAVRGGRADGAAQCRPR